MGLLSLARTASIFPAQGASPGQATGVFASKKRSRSSSSTAQPTSIGVLDASYLNASH